MEKENIFRSSDFYMSVGDVLHILLKDESGDTVALTLVGDGLVSSVPNQPVANAASAITSSSFTANWNFMENSTGYFLDVATDSAFTAFVAGFNNLDVGLVNTYNVPGLSMGTPYYYRVRAYNDYGTGISSETESLSTITIYDDWFLPSKDELNAIYTELFLNTIGVFSSGAGDYYWCSSEFDQLNSWVQRFIDGAQSSNSKGDTEHVRAIRAFTSVSPTYALRDAGPSGGWIFWKSGNNYLEVTASDQSHAHQWSNPAVNLLGTTDTAIGTGQANTTEIIGQAGHIDSAAKLCDDLIL